MDEPNSDLKREVGAQEALLSINRAVQDLVKPKDLANVVQVCFKSLKDMGLQFQALAIHRLLDEPAQTFESYDISSSKGILRSENSLPNVFRMWISGRPVYRRDLELDMGGLAPGRLNTLSENYGFPIRSILNVVHPRGTLALVSSLPNPFSKSEVRLVEQVGEVLSVGMARVEDIELLEESRKAQQESDERLRLALKSAEVGTWSWDHHLKVLQWDEFLHPLFGLEPGTFSGRYREFLKRVHPDDRKRVGNEITRPQNGEMTYDTEYRVIWPDGSEHHLASRGQVYWDGSGKAVQTVGICWDNSYRKEAERVEHEVQLAAEIQKGFLPEKSPLVEGFDIGGYLDSNGQIGGDFYDYISVSDTHLGIALGDAAGKGIPGALLIAKAQGVLRAEAENVSRTSEAITRLNRGLCLDNEAGRFVTLFYLVLNRSRKKINYVNAGHPPAFLFRGEEILPLKASGPPLGMFSDASYDQHSIALQEEDLIVIYSDGIPEASSVDGDFFDENRLHEVVQRNVSCRSGKLAHILCESARSFESGNHRPQDDKTVVILKVLKAS